MRQLLYFVLLLAFFFISCKDDNPVDPASAKPVVEIVSPLDKSDVADSVYIEIKATDNKGVDRVNIYIDDSLKTSLTTTPYTYYWSTAGIKDSSIHKIYAVAYNKSGNSTQSKTVIVTNFILTPSSLTAVQISDTSAVLSWINNTKLNTGFEVERAVNGTPYSRVDSISRMASVDTIKGLQPDSSYSFRIRAVAEFKKSGYSNEAKLTLTFPQPTNLTASFSEPDSVKLLWQNNCAYASGYEIWMAHADSLSFSKILTVDRNAQQVKIGGLTDTLYKFKIRAITHSHQSAYSNTAIASFANMGAFVPSGLTAKFASPDSIKLSWNDNCAFESGFEVWANSGSSSTFTSAVSLPPNTTQYTIAATSDTLYSFQVRAVAASKKSNFSNIASTRFSDFGVFIPSLLTSAFIHPDSIQLSWIDNCSFETGFEIWASKDNPNNFAMLSLASPNTNRITIHPGTDSLYYFQARAVASSKKSAFTNSSVASLSTLLSASAPTALTAKYVTQNNIQLAWKDNCSFETGFEIWTAENNANSFSKLTVVPANETGYTVTTLPDTQYTFKLRAITPAVQSDYSNTATASYSVLASAIAPKNLEAKFTGPESVQLNWSDNCSFENGYEVWMSTGNNGTFTKIASLDANAITYTVTGLKDFTSYAFQVRASVSPKYSSFSNTQVLLKSLPDVPKQEAPFDTSKEQLLTLTFTWDTATYAKNYVLQISSNSAFTDFKYNDTVYSTSYQMTGLNLKTTYYWRVLAVNMFGISSWSGVRSFTTGDVPVKPVLSKPDDAGKSIEGNPTMSWNICPTAKSYTLQVSTDASFTNLFYDKSVTSASQQISGLSPKTTYYWRVMAVNVFGNSEWSGVRSFITGDLPPIPVLVAPANGASNVAKDAEVVWNFLTTAKSYILQISRSSSFTEFIYNNTMTGTNISIGIFEKATVYYWRVAAVNSFGTTAWSSVYSFTTGDAPSTPSLLAPSNALTDLETNLQFSWSPASMANTYRLEISLNPDFTNVLDTITTDETKQKVVTFRGNTSYYWRVRATNTFGNSEWSQVWRFTTYHLGLVKLSGGTFKMGDYYTGLNTDGIPAHSVTLSPFKMGQTEVTQKLYTDVMGNNPSEFPNIGENSPVENLSWYECLKFCNQLSIREGKTPCYSLNGNTNPESWVSDSIKVDWTANGYRLPTEAEWEYAARDGGADVDYIGPATSDNVGDFGWISTNSGYNNHEAALKLPTNIGLYDMVGNVMEWCWDIYDNYSNTAQTNPTGPQYPITKNPHILRGSCNGSWANECRTFKRGSYAPSKRSSIWGLRIVCK